MKKPLLDLPDVAQICPDCMASLHAQQAQPLESADAPAHLLYCEHNRAMAVACQGPSGRWLWMTYGPVTYREGIRLSANLLGGYQRLPPRRNTRP